MAALQHHIELEDPMLVEQGEGVILCDVEQCRVSTAGSALVVLREVALGDPHVAALIDHQVGNTWSMTSNRAEYLEDLSRRSEVERPATRGRG